MLRTAVLIFAISCLAAQGQEFDAASVKPAASFVPAADYQLRGGPGTDDPGRITYPRVSVLGLVMRAFDVAEDQVSAPQVTATTWFNVTATLPPNTGVADFRLMLQHLLVQRFHLVVHHERKEAAGYDLVVASGGPKMKPSPSEDTRLEFRGFPPLLPGMPSATVITPDASAVRSTYRITLARLADILGRMIIINTSTGLLGGIPGAAAIAPRVVDRTGLAGKFDFTLEYGLQKPSRAAEASDPGGPTVFAAVEKQLGLKLVKTRNVPLDVVVIDHADAVPTRN